MPRSAIGSSSARARRSKPTCNGPTDFAQRSPRLKEMDIYTEPKGFDVHTLRNLGPLAPLAGIWEGTKGMDVKPKAEGAKSQEYVERFELQPIDPVTNGPQLLYGLRYHQRATKPNIVKTYHDQV